MSRDKTRIRSIVKSMKQLGASEEEIAIESILSFKNMARTHF